MRPLSIPDGHTTAPSAMRDIAARLGPLLEIPFLRTGAPKLLTKIRTPTRFGGERYIISRSMLTRPILNSATLDFFKPGLGSGTIAQVASPPYPEGPTPTPTRTATATATPTATATATVSPRPTPTPRPSPAPRSRPTPAHRPAPPP